MGAFEPPPDCARASVSPEPTRRQPMFWWIAAFVVWLISFA
jgi:hypothetical protein